MQWKQMQWPILIDPLNLLGVSAVPLTYLIDERGVIRAVNPSQQELQKFLDAPFSRSQEYPGPAATSVTDAPGSRRGSSEEALAEADNSFLWSGDGALNAAVSYYEAAVSKAPDHGPAAFRLGVALRRRYDSPGRREGDFQRAVQLWNRALQIDPNQYIWRRRIQQYGPRLDKPYPFYDWVNQARQEIIDRGEEPVELRVEPSGAEFAHPSEGFSETAAVRSDPDPENRIHRDEKGFIGIETTLVPDRIAPAGTARVHLVFRPNQKIRAHWNNEVEGLVVWLRPSEGWAVDSPYHELPLPPQPVSLESRRVEFEVQAPADFEEVTELPGYALYYVCEDVNGTCLYRRQDFKVNLSTP